MENFLFALPVKLATLYPGMELVFLVWPIVELVQVSLKAHASLAGRGTTLTSKLVLPVQKDALLVISMGVFLALTLITWHM